MTNIRFTSGDRHVVSAGGDDCRSVFCQPRKNMATLSVLKQCCIAVVMNIASIYQKATQSTDSKAIILIQQMKRSNCTCGLKDKLAKIHNLVTFFWLQFVCLEMCTYAALKGTMLRRLNNLTSRDQFLDGKTKTKLHGQVVLTEDWRGGMCTAIHTAKDCQPRGLLYVQPVTHTLPDNYTARNDWAFAKSNLLLLLRSVEFWQTWPEDF